jgi:hypothetical protein
MRSIPLKLWQKFNLAADNIASVPAYFAWILSENKLVEQTLLEPRYQKARAAYHGLLSPLTGVEAKVVDALERNGIYITTLDALNIAGTDFFFQAAEQLAQSVKKREALPAFSDRHEVHATLGEFRQYPEVFRWGLEERLLKIAHHYLGLAVGYDGASCVLSIADSREIGARAWHRDLEDRRMMKICVYLNRVDEAGGPLECVGPSLNAWLCEAEQYQRKSISDQEMQALSQFQKDGQKDWKVTCTGQKSTVIFLDTARFFHRGKPPTQQNRAAVFFHYFSHRPSRPFFCHRTPFSQGNIAAFLNELSPEQHACVSWKKNLPLVAKLIPRKRT